MQLSMCESRLARNAELAHLPFGSRQSRPDVIKRVGLGVGERDCWNATEAVSKRAESPCRGYLHDVFVVQGSGAGSKPRPYVDGYGSQGPASVWITG